MRLCRARGPCHRLVVPMTDVEPVLRVLARPVLVDRLVYATITLMSVLIIYDGWQHLRLIDVVGVIVGPVVAMFLGHVFSASMAKHVEVGRVLGGNELARSLSSKLSRHLPCK